MYHGTPNGDFTTFKSGTYFTDNKAYADRYQSPSASSISSGKVASNPKTFEVYLDIKKTLKILVFHVQEESLLASEKQKWRINHNFENEMTWNGKLHKPERLFLLLSVV